MNCLPLIDRELRTRARRRETHRQRLVASAVAIALVLVMLVVAEFSDAWQTLGGALFKALIVPAFIFSLFEGLRCTADCLSVEKREGTLGFLFLTDLSGLDVVLGKLAANAVPSLYVLLALFPALAIPFVLGGVTGGEFWRAVLALLATLFFALATGLFVSAAARQERHVWAAGWLIVTGSVFGLPLVDLLLAGGVPSRFIPLCSLVSAGYALYASLDAPFKSDPSQYWSALLMVHLASWLMLAVAALVLMRTWRESGEENSPGNRWLDRLERWPRWRIWGPKANRKRPENPAGWIIDPSRRLDAVLWLVLGTTLLMVILLRLFAGMNNFMVIVYASIFYLLHWLLKLWTAAAACYSVATARDSGLLELTLVTPLRAAELAAGCRQAIVRLFLGPMILLGTVEIILLVDYAMSSFGPNSGKAVFYTLLLVASLVQLALDLFALTYAGLWQGLIRRRPSQALARVVVWILVAPWLLVVMIPLLLLFCFPAVPVFFVTKDLVVITIYREKFCYGLREILQQGFLPEQAPEGWRSWWPPFGGKQRAAQPPVPPPLPPSLPPPAKPPGQP